MELIGDIPYELLHKVLIETLKDKGIEVSDDRILKDIGLWLYRFHSSELKEFTLKLPGYRKELLEPITEYCYYLDQLIKVIRSQNTISATDLSLFDIHSYRSSDTYYKKHRDFNIRFLKTERQVHQFESGIAVSSDRFLPLFHTEQIAVNKEALGDIFFLFKAIARNNIIQGMVSIDLSSDVTVIVTESYALSGQRVRSTQLTTASLKNDHDKREEVINDLETIDVSNNIIIRYPYHTNISSALTDCVDYTLKRFNLELSRRFNYNEIESNEIVVTLNETKGVNDSSVFNVLERFEIVQTDSDSNFAVSLRSLIEDWRAIRFNVFSMPIPVKWFMCIHQGEPLERWHARFKVDFPGASGKLLEDSLHIVDLFYQLDWTRSFSPEVDRTILLLPRTTIFQDAVLSLRDHLTGCFRYIGFVDDESIIREEEAEIWILDPFNVVLINNIQDRLDLHRIKMVVPDILYYIYRPFIKFQIAKYPFLALTAGARSDLDDKYLLNIKEWEERSPVLLSSLRTELKAYQSRLGLNVPVEAAIADEEDVFDLTKAELVQSLSRKEQKLSESYGNNVLYINTVEGENFQLKRNTPVLIVSNGYLMRTVASLLEKGTKFIPLQSVIKNLDVSSLVDRMVSVSKAALNWCRGLYELNEIDGNLYSNLKKDGLSISQGTFNNDYLVKEPLVNEFHLPRAKNDWKIVCDRLSVTDERATWMAHKCREDINRLKKAYDDIIQLLIETGNFGVNVSDDIIESVAVILARLPDPETEEHERKTNAITVLNEINNKISLGQVDQITEEL